MALNQAGVAVSLDEDVVVDGSGRFALSLNLPQVAPGDWNIQLDKFGVVEADTSIRILPNPSINVDSIQVFPGKPLEIKLVKPFLVGRSNPG